MSGCLELLHRYVFYYYSNLNKQIYIYCTFSWSTKSMQYLPRGFMSFKMSAIIISIPLDSWVAMQVWKIREGSRRGEREGRRGEKSETGQAEGGRGRIHTSANFQNKDPELERPCNSNEPPSQSRAAGKRATRGAGEDLCTTELTPTLPVVKYTTGKKVVQAKICLQWIMQSLAPSGTSYREQPTGALPDSAEHTCRDIKDMLERRHNQICTSNS